MNERMTYKTKRHEALQLQVPVNCAVFVKKKSENNYFSIFRRFSNSH